MEANEIQKIVQVLKGAIKPTPPGSKDETVGSRALVKDSTVSSEPKKGVAELHEDVQALVEAGDPAKANYFEKRDIESLIQLQSPKNRKHYAADLDATVKKMIDIARGKIAEKSDFEDQAWAASVLSGTLSGKMRFAEWNDRRAVLLGAEDCERVGLGACQREGFTKNEADSIVKKVIEENRVVCVQNRITKVDPSYTTDPRKPFNPNPHYSERDGGEMQLVYGDPNVEVDESFYSDRVSLWHSREDISAAKNVTDEEFGLKGTQHDSKRETAEYLEAYYSRVFGEKLKIKYVLSGVDGRGVPLHFVAAKKQDA